MRRDISLSALTKARKNIIMFVAAADEIIYLTLILILSKVHFRVFALIIYRNTQVSSHTHTHVHAYTCINTRELNVGVNSGKMATAVASHASIGSLHDQTTDYVPLSMSNQRRHREQVSNRLKSLSETV